MLKIKDNIDLKELEKLGFIKNDVTKYTKIYIFKGKLGNNDLSFSQKTGNLLWCQGCLAFDLLYDLIKADMVEKVSD